MSYNTLATSPLSPSSNSIVTDLESALMQSIDQGLQAGQGTSSGGLQQEMQLLTDLLNQSTSNQNDPSQQSPSPGGSTPQTPTTDNSSPNTNSGVNRAESRLERVLEGDITKALQNGQQPTKNNSLGEEVNLLIQLLSQSQTA